MTRHFTRTAFALLVLPLGAAMAAPPGLDRTERAIARHAAEGQAAAEAMLERVVDIE